MKKAIPVILIILFGAGWPLFLTISKLASANGDALVLNLDVSGPQIESYSIIPGKPMLEFTAEGEVLINGKPVKELSHPEIKKSLQSIAESLQRQIENDDRVEYFNRQTTYLLKEIEACRRQLNLFQKERKL